jgi:cell division protein FtsN
MAISEPAPGQYWQVMAAERPDAELIAEELAKKGMKTLLAPAPKEGYYRVLVGPFSNPANMAEIRTSLESAGFKNPIVRKY